MPSMERESASCLERELSAHQFDEMAVPRRSWSHRCRLFGDATVRRAISSIEGIQNAQFFSQLPFLPSHDAEPQEKAGEAEPGRQETFGNVRRHGAEERAARSGGRTTVHGLLVLRREGILRAVNRVLLVRGQHLRPPRRHLLLTMEVFSRRPLVLGERRVAPFCAGPLAIT